MKRFALPALLVAIAFFGINSTASAHPGHGGGHGHIHGGGYGQFYGGGFRGGYGGYGRGCSQRGYFPRNTGYYRFNNRGFYNYGPYYRGNGGLRIRTGNFGFGIRF